MKFRFCTKLLIIILVVMFLSNLIFLTNVKGRDNTTYLMGSSYYFGNASTYILDKLPFWYRNCLGYNIISQDNPTTTQFWESLYADVQILDGHGDWDRFIAKNVGIITGNGRDIDGKHYFGTNDVHWKYDTDLVIYLACKTAQDLENGLAMKTLESGAQNVIGWLGPIRSDDAAYWANYFSASAGAGTGIYDAASKANSMTFPGDDDDNNETNIRGNAVFNHGNANMRLGRFKEQSPAKVNNINSNSVLEDERNILRNNKKILKFNSVEEIIDIIKKYDSTFKEEDYKISQSDGMKTINVVTGEKTEQQVIDLHLKLGEFHTNAGYVVTISNGIVEAIYDNTLPLKDKAKKISDKSFIVDNSIKKKSDAYKELAKAEVINKVKNENCSEYDIIEQRQNYYYDVNTGKKYSRVRTVVEIKCGDRNIKDYVTTLFEI